MKSYFSLVLLFCFSQFAYANYIPNSNNSLNSLEQNQKKDLILKQYINEFNAIDNNDRENVGNNANLPKNTSNTSLDKEQSFSYHENTVDPHIQQYLVGLLDHLKEDVDFLTNQCGMGINGQQEQIKFNQCFEKNKEKLKNNTFKYSASLSLAFLNKEETKRNAISQDFVTLYQQELNKISVVAKEAKLPQEIFQKSLTLFYIKLVKEAYEKNKIIVNDDKQLTHEVDTYFIQLTHNLDIVLNNVNNNTK